MVELERWLATTDAERSPKVFRVARPEPDGGYETLELPARPVVR